MRNDPLVRKACELFDASVIAVVPRFAGDEAKAEEAGEDPPNPVESTETKSTDDPISFDGADEVFE